MKIDWAAHGIDIARVRGGKGYCPRCTAARRHKGDRSLSVDTVRGLYKCHNHPCDFQGCAAEDAAQHTVRRAYSKPLPRLQKVSDKVLRYFEGRGISNNTLLAFRITEGMEWMPGCEQGTKQLAICFNYYRGGQLVNIKYRTADKKFRMEKDAELICYNLDACAGRKEIIITEGEIDALTAWECGLPHVISVPNGASMGHARLEYLDNCWQELEHLEKITIATDADAAGHALQQELIRRLGPDRCYTIHYPDGYKDLNEVYYGDAAKNLPALGKATVQQLVADAVQPPLEGVQTVLDIVPDVMRIYMQGYPRALSLGWKLDEHLRWRPGELTVVTGTPNAGKSTWVNNVLERLARLHGWKAALFSPEKNPAALLIAELAQIHAGQPFYKADAARKMDLPTAKQALDFVNNHFCFLKVDEIDITIDGLVEKAVQCVRRYGINCLVLDPWNYLEHKRPPGMTETEYVSEALTRLVTFCKRYQVHTFLIAHPTKIKKDMKTKQFEVPSLYDISGSAHFFNKADNGVVIYRNYAQNCTDIYVQKIRWFFTGKVGDVQQFFKVESMRFEDG